MALVDFSKVEVKDLNGKPIKEAQLHKLIAQGIYTLTKELDLVQKAFDINAGKPVELNAKEIEEVKRLINDDRLGIAAFARAALLDILDKA